MKEFYHDYLGFGRIKSQCLVKIVSTGKTHYILFENLGLGTSVTNASEQLASEIVAKYGFDPKECRFFETYSEYDYDSFDEIEYNWLNKKDGWEAKNPKWKPGLDAIKKLLI